MLNIKHCLAYCLYLIFKFSYQQKQLQIMCRSHETGLRLVLLCKEMYGFMTLHYRFFTPRKEKCKVMMNATLFRLKKLSLEIL